MGWRRRVFLLGKALEHNAVHSQCRRISFKRKGDDAPPVFGVTLADIRRGKRRRTGRAPAAVTDIMDEAGIQRRARRIGAVGVSGGCGGFERRGIAAVEWVGGGEYFC